MAVYEPKSRTDLIGAQDRQRRGEKEFFSRCAHSSKIVEGNVVRCGACKKVIGFVRAPKR